MPTWSPRKIDKYELGKGKEILHPDQSREVEQAKFAYSLGKAFRKQTKLIEDQGEKNKNNSR